MKFKQGRRNQRGVVLLLALVALLLISAVGASLLYMATANVRFVGAQQASARTFHATTGALEEGRFRVLPVLQSLDGGLNYLKTQNGIFPCSATEVAGTFIPCNTTGDPGRYAGRRETVLYIVNAAAPAVPTDDDLVATEIPGFTAVAISTIQPGAGTAVAVPWSWLRVNLKTEQATGQDIDLDGVANNQLPVFLYMGREFNMDDLAVFDPDGAASPAPAGSVLPWPWGPNPFPLIDDRPCLYVLCAAPVYALTAKTLEPATNASRIARTEVATLPPFAIDGAMYSNPNINLSGNVLASGRDICDTDCNCTPGDPGCNLTAPFTFAGQAGFAAQDTLVTDPTRSCRTVNPMQSSAPACAPMAMGGPGCNNVGNAAADSDPGPLECALFNNGQPCASGGTGNAAIASNVTNPYDVNELISMLSTDAVTLTDNLAAYYPQSRGGASMGGCATGNCQGQQTDLGGFPVADPINGVGADPVTTYVSGNLKCTASCRGAGILLVDGDLEINGSFAFYGIIMVSGQVRTLGGGASPADCNIYGSIMAGGTVTTSAGGAICFQYNSCAQQMGTRTVPPRLLSFREIPE